MYASLLQTTLYHTSNIPKPRVKMTMVKTDSTITDIQGKVGGDIWRTDQCRHHLQAYPRLIDANLTKPQRKRRRAFKKLLNYIRKNATEYFAQAWQIYANQHPKKTCKGKTYTLTWHQQFISYNINRVIAGEEIIPLPPGY